MCNIHCQCATHVKWSLRAQNNPRGLEIQISTFSPPPSSLNKKRNCLQIRNDPDASNTTRGRYITPKKIRDNQRDSQDKHQIQKRTTPPPSGQNRTPPISSSFTVIHPRYVLDVMTRKTDSCLRHVKTNKKKTREGNCLATKKRAGKFWICAYLERRGE